MSRPKGSKNKVKEQTEVVIRDVSPIKEIKTVDVKLIALDHGYVVSNGENKAFATWEEVSQELQKSLEV